MCPDVIFDIFVCACVHVCISVLCMALELAIVQRKHNLAFQKLSLECRQFSAMTAEVCPSVDTCI